MNKRKNIFLLLALAWMAVIFAFSSRTGVESTEDSYTAGLMVGRLTVPHFADWSDEEQLAFAEKIDHPVRKTAHALEYALLGFLWLGAVYETAGSVMQRDQMPDTAVHVRREKASGTAELERHEKSKKSAARTNRRLDSRLSAWLITTAYAATDEFHQLFVPGRSGQCSDVCLDSCGAIVGVLAGWALFEMVLRLRRRRQETDNNLGEKRCQRDG